MGWDGTGYAGFTTLKYSFLHQEEAWPLVRTTLQLLCSARVSLAPSLLPQDGTENYLRTMAPALPCCAILSTFSNEVSKKVAARAMGKEMAFIAPVLPGRLRKEHSDIFASALSNCGKRSEKVKVKIKL